MKILTVLLLTVAGFGLSSCSSPPDAADATVECRKLIRDELGSNDVDFKKTVRNEQGDQTFQITGSLTDASKATRSYDCTVQAKSDGAWKTVDLFVGDPL